jgi:hypothetical protein
VDLGNGKLTDRICGPANAGGAFDEDPAPPDAHGVECVAVCLEPDAAPRPGKAVDEVAARDPGTRREFWPIPEDVGREAAAASTLSHTALEPAFRPDVWVVFFARRI